MTTASKLSSRCSSLLGPASSEEMHLFSDVIVWTSFLSSHLLCLVRNHKGFVLRWRLWTDFFRFLVDVLVGRQYSRGVINQHGQNKGKEVTDVRDGFQHKARHDYRDAWQLKKATVYVRVSTDREVLCHTQCVLTEHKLMNEKVNRVKCESWFWH